MNIGIHFLLVYISTVSSVSVFTLPSEGTTYISTLNVGGNLAFSSGQLTFCVRIKFRRLWEDTGLVWIKGETGRNDVDLPDDFQMELGLSRLRISISQTRRYYFLQQSLRALQWHHICITVNSSVASLMIDGMEQHSIPLNVSAFTGNEVRIGGVHNNRKYSGEVTQVNMWDRPLSLNEIQEIAKCIVDTQGNKVSWTTGPWKIKGTGDISNADFDSFCNDPSRNTVLMFPPMELKHAYQFCKSMPGYLPKAMNKSEALVLSNRIDAMYQSSSSSSSCDKVWADLMDDKKEGQWTNIHEKHQISQIPDYIEWRTGEPDGNIIENCVVLDLTKENIGFEDVECHYDRCVICIVEETPLWRLKGACIADDRNKNFIGTQESPGEIMKLIGYSDFSINFENEFWVWKNTKENTIIAKMENPSTKEMWPQGRKSWNLQLPVCDRKMGENITLLLSPCGDGQFTCNDGSCIQLKERCDLKPDCMDKSDETECVLVQFPASYRPDIPPELSNEDIVDSDLESYLPITLNLMMESLNVHTSNMEMHTNLNLSMTWFDSRIDFWNLNLDKTLNRIPQILKDKLWAPVVDFTNTKGNHITALDKEAVLVANMLSKPELAADKWPEEVHVYPGHSNSLSVSRKYSHTFQCQFHLARYPFDEQSCVIEMTMLSASSKLLRFDEKSSTVQYTGNLDLVEYTVGGVKLHFKNDRDFAVLFVEVELIRQAGFILMNVYIPSKCLLVISYLTLYFNPSIFQVRVLGSLTTLLVMTTVFTQASSSLPKTSYFKMVDVWLLSNILIIFIIICFHTAIDRTIEKEKYKSIITVHPEVPTNEQKHGDGKAIKGKKKLSPSRILILTARIVLIVLLVLFNIIYWYVALKNEK